MFRNNVHRGDGMYSFNCKTSPEVTGSISIASDYLDSISREAGVIAQD